MIHRRVAHRRRRVSSGGHRTRVVRIGLRGGEDAPLHQAAVADGVLPAKVKELMALAIAVVKQCDGCIAFHAKAAARRGATPDEVAEALGVALLMDGGTASVYGPRAWDAYREFANGRAEIRPVTVASG
jgi:AhpD family alkylhydroperoxidase